jgi:hypothetical protein
MPTHEANSAAVIAALLRLVSPAKLKIELFAPVTALNPALIPADLIVPEALP